MRSKTNRKLAVIFLVAITVTAHLAAQDVTASGGDTNALLNTIAQINHINWVVNVIKTYNNALVLEEEYEKISYGNLNLNRIPDEETRGRITNMLDVLYSLRKDEREMKHWRGKFLDERMRKMREYDLGTAKRVWGLFRKGIFGFMTYDIGTVLQTAFDVGHSCLSLQYDYDNFVHSFDQEMQDKVFAFDSQKMALIHKLNKEMLDDQWRLVQKYRLDDKATRVTDTDINALLSVLKDGNASRIYTRLVPMKGRYKHFPEYWYYLTCAAMETGHFKEGRDACDTFFKVNRGIFRDDPMAGTVALNKAMMLDKDKANLPELRRCLEIVWEANQNRSNWEQDFVVASLYDGILHDNKKAVEILEHAIAGLESEMSERKRMGKDITVLGKTLGEYHAFLFRLIPNEPMPAAIRASEFISFSDKLRYLARSKETNAWETIRDDILGVSFDKSKGVWTVPASWLLNENVPVKFIMPILRLGSETETGELCEITSGRRYNSDATFSLEFNKSKIDSCEWEMFGYEALIASAGGVSNEQQRADFLKDVDAIPFLLVFNHPEFPVELCFADKGMNYQKGCTNMFLFGFSALGKGYDWLPESGLDTPVYSPNVTSRQRYDAFTSKYVFVPLDRSEFACPDHWVVNGVKLVKVKIDKEVSLEYRNVTSNNFRPFVTMVFMNELGMVIYRWMDNFYGKYTKSHRTVTGLFSDDHYTDYTYQYMSPNETRIFSMPRPAKAKYLLILVEARYNLTATNKGTL